MRRIRITLLAVCLALLIPVTVLTWRALDGLSFERDIRHQTVSDRTFEEMERALSRFLEREEERPFEHYRFYLRGSDRRSPLARGGAEDFVVGAFQIDPDGSVHTPLRPRDTEAARTRGDWPPPPEVAHQVEVVTRLAETTWRTEPAEPDDEGAAAQSALRQAPGTTRAIGGRLAKEEAEARSRADRIQKKEDTTAYEVLRSFNRAAASRAERKQKVARAPSPALYDKEKPEAAAPRRARRAAEAAPAVVEEALLPDLGSLRYEVGPAPAEMEALADAPAAEGTKLEEDAGVRIALDPMAGRAADPDHLLLYRTVLVGQQGYRQGLVLDRHKLGEWLEREVIRDSGLELVARVGFHATGKLPPPPANGAAYVFDHRFAEPFDALTARLHLAALPGVGSPGAVYGLVALLVVVGSMGLLAIYRMVGVAFHFAERRSNFVAAVTHELKTPLTAIRMYGEMLRDGLVDAEKKRREYYGTITDESERLSRLIDNVLEFARLERGTREMNWTVGSVGPILEEAAEKLRTHAGRGGFSIELDVEDELPAVRFDRDALLQVLFNLVDNAMKYARVASKCAIVLEARRMGAEVVVSVRDYGPGVPRRHLTRIFEPFYRGGDERTRTTKGTGIGLALVKDLCERMGAAVSGANVDGGGFRVRLAFPAADGTA